MGFSMLLSLTVAYGLAVSMSSVDAAQHENYITSKKTYQPQQAWQNYSSAPEGFHAVMVQHVARHGSRGLSSADDDDLLMQLWQQAKQENALTPLGEKLGAEIERLTSIQQQIGYGEISTLGRQEHADMATRMLQRHPQLFSAERPLPILVSHSGRSRAAKSGEAFLEQMLAEKPELQAYIEEPYGSVETLYFHKAEGSEGFDDYKDNDPQLIAAMDDIFNDSRTEEAISKILGDLFDESFIQRLQQGDYHFSAQSDPEDTLSTPWEAVEALYGLYSVAPNLRADGELDFSPFLADEQASWLAYIDDADSFYGRGPGFVGNDITYRAADALIKEMMEQIESIQTSSEPVTRASLRFTHAQVTMPIATWLQLENTDQKVTPEQPYTYQDNSWRAAQVSPMGANVQWDVYANDSGEILVRMLHNEKEVRFAGECKSLPGHDYFYQYEELTRCFREIHGFSR